MTNQASFNIEDLQTYREGKRLEVKSAKGGLPNSPWETYSAFANSDGGVIVLGVKEREDGSFLIEGLNDAHKLLKYFWNAVNNRQKVSCNILTDSMVNIEKCDGKDVIVIRVSFAERTTKPVYVGCDPRNGTMLKMLAMVEYGERAGSGLHRIFHTWETVCHCKPTMETTASGGVDRTVLRLNYEGHQPDTEAMRRLYDNPEAITFGEQVTQEIKVVKDPDHQNDPQNDKCDPQNDILEGQNDLQNVIVDPQKRLIVASILKNSRISREGLANKVGVSESTIKRRLKEWGIFWEGHPKTGHWVIPDKLSKPG